MKIEITEESVRIFRDMGIPTDQIGSAIMVINCMLNGNYDMLDAFDDSNTNKNSLIVYKELEKAGMLERTVDNVYNFCLTNDAIALMEAISHTPEKKEEPISSDEWISQYRELWINPETGKYYTTPDRRSLGAPLKDLSVKMKKFISEYRDIFTKLPSGLTPQKVILEATKNYISEYKKVRFAYCKDAYNFIMKQEGSTKDTTRSLLATNCENYILGFNHRPETDTIFERNKSVN